MQKLSNYDSVTAQRFGEFKDLPPGGYVCRILKAQEATSLNGNPMLVMYVDIAEGEYSGFFKDKYDNDTRDDKKWPAGAILRQMTGGNSTRFFKGLIKDIEESNPRYKWDWDEAGLKGKFIGGIFGEEEYIGKDKNGNDVIRKSCKIKYTRTVNAIRDEDFEIPKLKELKRENYPALAVTGHTASEYENTPENLNDIELPF